MPLHSRNSVSERTPLARNRALPRIAEVSRKFNWTQRFTVSAQVDVLITRRSWFNLSRARVCARKLGQHRSKNVLGPLPDTESYRDSQLRSVREYFAAITAKWLDRCERKRANLTIRNLRLTFSLSLAQFDWLKLIYSNLLDAIESSFQSSLTSDNMCVFLRHMYANSAWIVPIDSSSCLVFVPSYATYVV